MSVPQFGRWRAYIWPIHRSEVSKFIPMFLIYFLVAFNYSAFRVFKDAMVVTAPSSGAEAVPFIKVWAILPGALLLTFIFTRLSNRYSREKVFYVMISIFLCFFFFFTLVLYPLRDLLHPHQFADSLQSYLPAGFKGLIALFRNWTFTAFYVMSELWGTAIMSMLFWAFANEVTAVDQAKRFYGLLTLGANIAGILAGQATILCSSNSFIEFIPYGKTAWDQSILFLNFTVLVSGVLTIVLFRWLNRNVIKPGEADSPHREEPENKIKMSMRKNFAYLAQSKYLLCIALIVLTYNIVMNLVEVVWKNQIKQVYPDPTQFSIYMGEVMTIMGIVATVFSVLITGNVIRKFSWTWSAMLSPAIILVTSMAFFVFVMFQNSALGALASFFGATPLLFSVKLGALQNIMARSCKYTVYDATKEIAFIPLDRESKLKGKAAIDGVGSRLGKSGGSVVHQGAILFFSSVSASTPFIAATFLIVITVWVLSVMALGKQFDALAYQKKPSLSESRGAPA